LLTFQSNRFKENSGSGSTLVLNGTHSIQRFSPFGPSDSYSTSTIGGSTYCGTGGDYLTTASVSATALQSNNFTIEFWVYLTNASANAVQAFYANYVTYSAGSNALFFGKHASNSGYVALWLSNYSASSAMLSETSLPPGNAWTHYALVRNGSTFTLYRNGTSTASATYAGSVTSTTAPNYIMAAGDGPTLYPPTGYIADFRIVNGTAVYTSNFTPPTTPLTAITNTALLLNFTNAGIVDGAMQNDLQTVGDAKLSTAVSKFGSSSMSFDGTGDYLTTPLLQNLQFGTGDFTVECWNYMIARTNTQPAIFSNYNNYTTGALSLFAGHSGGTTTAYQVAINGASFPVIQGGTIAYNTWVHLAVVRYNGTIKLYINGTSVGTPYSTAVTLNGVGSLFYIGSTGDSLSTGCINGYIDDFRITKGYARYTANFTPPSLAFQER
jgi:hypothetical protein